MKIVSFVPIRLNIKRIVGKNLKMLGEKPLMHYILETLSQARSIDEIYVFCSSEEIQSFPLLALHESSLKRKICRYYKKTATSRFPFTNSLIFTLQISGGSAISAFSGHSTKQYAPDAKYSSHPKSNTSSGLFIR